MLKRLFTSNARIKLMTLFLTNPDEEYYIRELTRKLDEQINSIRRELDNLKRLGLLKTKSRNRKKYYVVNKDFIFYNELKSIITKSQSDQNNIVKTLSQFGNLEVVVLSGVFTDKESSIDLLIVGEINRDKLEHFLSQEMEGAEPVRFSVMTKDEYVYRRKCNDKFLHDIMEDNDNIIALNRVNG
ncbi:hypothetical protein GF340_04665 [Candidatus Peregrinibacteria bacterium]|nr:hypothetical protein [Candidatus Peregrinibacteria bacterium]